MRNTNSAIIRSVVLGVSFVLGSFAAGTSHAMATHREGAVAAPVRHLTAVTIGERVRGCDVLLLWSSYRTEIVPKETQVRVRGALGWTRVGYPVQFTDKIASEGPTWNWPVSLMQERCDRDRRYRLRIFGTRNMISGASNYPWFTVERWIYFPSSTGWTRRTSIDFGYVDLCLMDGTKCDRPYYPSGPTPVLTKHP